MRSPSLSQSFALLCALGIIVLGNADLVSAKPNGRFPSRVSAPRGLGQPRRNTTVAGGTRGISATQFCGQTSDSNAFTALIPKTDSILYTTNADPLLLVYVPELPPTSSGDASLTVMDESGAVLGQANLDIPLSGGLVGFTLPEDLLPLENEEFYQWGLQIPCQKKIDLSDPIVEGWIGYQEVPVDSMAVEDVETVLETIDNLAEAGFWLDAVMQVSSLLDIEDETILEMEVIPRLEQLLEQEDLGEFVPYFLE